MNKLAEVFDVIPSIRHWQHKDSCLLLHLTILNLDDCKSVLRCPRLGQLVKLTNLQTWSSNFGSINWTWELQLHLAWLNAYYFGACVTGKNGHWLEQMQGTLESYCSFLKLKIVIRIHHKLKALPQDLVIPMSKKWKFVVFVFTVF